MSKLDDACKDVVSGVEGAVACVVVDLTNGRLLGRHVPGRPAAFAHNLGNMTLELLAKGRTGVIEAAFHAKSGGPEGDGLQEAHVLTRGNHHYARSLRKGRVGILLVTERSTNVVLGSAQMRAAVPRVESQLP